MELDFVNHTEELSQLDEHARAGGLLVVFGRRRAGKTRLLTQWLRRHQGFYSQAIEASKDQQLQQVFEDLRPQLSSNIVPRSFGELQRRFRCGVGQKQSRARFEVLDSSALSLLARA